MTKTLAQVEKALATRYDGPIKEIDGKGYVPWNNSLAKAIEVFGPDGFDIVVDKVQPVGEGYMAIVTITAITSDGRAFSRSNVGYSDVRQTKAGKLLTDMAIKAAVSDAISRTLKLFGDAFALFLYDKDDVANQGGATPTSTPRAAAPRRQADEDGDDLGPRPSDKQMFHLGKAGYTPKMVAAMTFADWKGVLDEYFAQKDQKPTPGRAATPADYSDDEDDF